MGGKDWTYEDGKVITKCYTNFPDVFFAINGRWVQLSASDYVHDTSFAKDRSECTLNIKSLDMPYIVLGNPIFIDYYTIHKADTGQMGIAPHVVSSKRDLERVTSIDNKLKAITKHGSTAETPWSWIIVVVLFSLLVVLYMLFALPEIMSLLPNDVLAHWIISISIGIAGILLMIFLVQPAIESSFRKEEFQIYWLEDLKYRG